jgi:hypothetical protein
MKLRIAEATENATLTQWGVYCERDDKGEWTPLIYDAPDRQMARSWLRTFAGPGYRNATLVKRKVEPWRASPP